MPKSVIFKIASSVHEICWLQVTMDHLCVIVRVIERLTELSDPVGELMRFKHVMLFSARNVESVSPSTCSMEMQPERSSWTKS
jgi:hypothetical protein